MRRNEEGLVRLLIEAGGVASGAALSGRLGISRTALWKRIEALRARGFEIAAEGGRGYRYVKGPGFSAEELRLALKGSFGREAVFVGEASSTNDMAMELASGGAPEGTVVVADSQRKGRGRLGRLWVSPPGCNIYMSVVLRPQLQPKDAPVLTIVSAVATAEAMRSATGVEAKIKWPNDIVVGGRKIAGILLETRSEPDRGLYAVAGIGVNVNMPLGALPKELRESATSVLALTGKEHSRTEIMAPVLDGLSTWLGRLALDGPAPVIKRWKEMSSTIGATVRVVAGGKAFAGKALGIDGSGRLLVESGNGATIKVAAGDVEMLRPKARGGLPPAPSRISLLLPRRA